VDLSFRELQNKILQSAYQSPSFCLSWKIDNRS